MNRTSYAQFHIMVDFMEKNGDLSKPNAGSQDRIRCMEKWQELTELLNSEGGGKSVTEDRWKKVWSDLKNNTKKKLTKIQNRSANGTNRPSFKNTLSYLEHRILSIIGIQEARDMIVAEIGSGQGTEPIIQLPSPAEDANQKFIIPNTYTVISTNNESEECPSPQLPLPDYAVPQSPPPRSITPPPSTSSSRSEISRHSSVEQKPKIRRKMRFDRNMNNFLVNCVMNAREDNREKEKMHMELERERIRQRDTELQLQMQMMEFMKEALGLLSRYDGKK